ncbi:hypothetical protein E3N88_37617 [Mikania micrantha]|uniref:Uncharacterized protein n=1 Tax=Mikania micrantha TaxID=192012 RepID=A0A5N6LRV0_9ASTR|nr:hypothetical protein E3N88_37617 [Mikania micrantha]
MEFSWWNNDDTAVFAREWGSMAEERGGCFGVFMMKKRKVALREEEEGGALSEDDEYGIRYEKSFRCLGSF